VYNILSCIGAFLLLTPHAWAIESIAPAATQHHAELALVGFHRPFHFLGVVLVLAFADAFASVCCRLNAAFQLLDHLQRLHERCDEDPERGLRLSQTAVLVEPSQRFVHGLRETTSALAANTLDCAESFSPEAAALLREQAPALCLGIMAEAGQLAVPSGTRSLENLRWLHRVGYHVSRVTHDTSVLGVADRRVDLPSRQESFSPIA
jgi:hypothetical protein